MPTPVEQSLQYAHLASENGKPLSGTRNLPRHIISPSSTRIHGTRIEPRTMCGIKLDRDYVVASRLFTGEKLCGNCDRMRSSAIFELKLLNDKNLVPKDGAA